MSVNNTYSCGNEWFSRRAKLATQRQSRFQESVEVSEIKDQQASQAVLAITSDDRLKACA